MAVVGRSKVMESFKTILGKAGTRPKILAIPYFSVCSFGGGSGIMNHSCKIGRNHESSFLKLGNHE